MIRTEVTQMLIAALLAGLTIGGVIRVWEIFVLALVQGVVGALDAPARHALSSRWSGPRISPMPSPSRRA